MTTTCINLEDLEGAWYIIFSNFPMWLKGDKTSPSLNYSVQMQGGVRGLGDEVISWKQGKKQSIIGFDTPLDEANLRFEWRGKGLLSLLSSRWEIVYLDAAKEWAIIYFEKTLFTPKGYDVIARNQHLSPETFATIHAILLELGTNASLQPIVQK